MTYTRAEYRNCADKLLQEELVGILLAATSEHWPSSHQDHGGWGTVQKLKAFLSPAERGTQRWRSALEAWQGSASDESPCSACRIINITNTIFLLSFATVVVAARASVSRLRIICTTTMVTNGEVIIVSLSWTWPSSATEITLIILITMSSSRSAAREASTSQLLNRRLHHQLSPDIISIVRHLLMILLTSLPIVFVDILAIPMTYYRPRRPLPCFVLIDLLLVILMLHSSTA